MQKLFRLRATDLTGSTGRSAETFLGLLVAGTLLASHILPVTASPQTPTPGIKPNISAEEQKIRPAPQNEEEWRMAMSRTAPPHKGCFTAAYPKMDWVEAQCATVSAGPHYPVQGTAMGNNNTLVANIIGTGSVSAAIGSFDSVSVTGETDSVTSQSDTFSLQLNTNYFQASFCNFDFCGWQQFVFASQGCGPDDCVFIQYWIRDWTQATCPMGWDLISDVGNRRHCRVISPGMTLPKQSIASLGVMSLAGVLQPNNPPDSQVAAIFGTGGTMVTAVGGDFLDLIGNPFWHEAEFNVFGQGPDSEAVFNLNTTLVVRTQLNESSGNIAPACFHLGFTRETNNLHLIGPTAISPAPLPSITFQETNKNITAVPDCASSVGDTHLTTFDGLFYDFQAEGEFLLAQPAPDFVVHTQQVSGAPNWPNAAINKAVGIKMGKSQVAICLDPYRLEVDGKRVLLDKGKSVSLPEDVILLRRSDTYFIARPGGDVVRADVNNNEYIDVSVGHAPGAKASGLLGNANGPTSDDIATQGGTVLNQPVSFTDLYGRYADSWRVPPSQSLLCKGQKIETGKPGAPIYAGNLTQSQYNSAQAVCTAAGVKDPTLLEACILDVTVIGNNNAANVFAGLTPPVAVMRVQIAGSVPGGGIGAPGTNGTTPGGTPLGIPK